MISRLCYCQDEHLSMKTLESSTRQYSSRKQTVPAANQTLDVVDCSVRIDCGLVLGCVTDQALGVCECHI
jgi:hypothetical protein